MVQQRNEVPGGVHFFVSLETHGKSPVFRDTFFKTKVERRWTAHLEQYPKASAKDFVVNDRALHAMVILPAQQPEPEQLLHEILSGFQAAVLPDWKGPGELWNPQPKVRRIQTKDELRSLRDFIIQKMLGGKELSSPGDFEDDEGYGYDPD